MEARQEAGLDIVPSATLLPGLPGCAQEKRGAGFYAGPERPGDEGVFVDFFGKAACTRSGLAFLSAHAQAPVVPAFIYRKLDGTHQLEIQPPLEPPADREPATLLAATQRYTRIIEDAIRRHPDQWIWMHRRWRTRAPGG
jgi:KDO2-lipid IV(A) lauroyltransferase